MNARQKEALGILSDYVPVFEAKDFKAGTWSSPKREKGVVILPYFSFSPDVLEFERSAYDSGCVLSGFDWPNWMESDEARLLLESAGAVEAADGEQLLKLVTAHIRGDRFSEGTLAEAFESGLMLRIARRAGELLKAA